MLAHSSNNQEPFIFVNVNSIMTIVHFDDIDDKLLQNFDLMHVSEDDLNIARQVKGKGFCFYTSDGTLIANESEKQRLLNIAVPPAYTNVMYAQYKNAHIQAVGHDSNKKRQYFYHEEWEILRNVTKFSSLEAFGHKLPSFRRKIARDLKSEDMPKIMVIAAMFRILDQTGMRVGSAKAVKSNQTYGLTTLNAEHIDVKENGEVAISYTGKGGVEITQNLSDKNIVEVLENCTELHGQSLFKHEGGIITSTHINQTIKNHFGEQYSAKDFRTWRFSCLFLEKIIKLHKKDESKIILKDVLEAVSQKTGNTPAVLQSSYIHPGLIDIAKNNSFKNLNINKISKAGLRKCEAVFLDYLTTKHAKESLFD